MSITEMQLNSPAGNNGTISGIFSAFPQWIRQTVTATFAFSLALHAFILFGIGFSLPQLQKLQQVSPPLHVVLVNSKSQSAPKKADALAQNNLDGGGNTPKDRTATTPLPVLNDALQYQSEQSAQRVQQLEQEVRRLMTQASIRNYRVPQPTVQNPESRKKDARNKGKDPDERSLQIARLEAEISKNLDAYQKLPRRKFIGARTEEYRFAQYIEDWRTKVERVGNRNYPQAAREKQIYGNLQLSVSIHADGRVEKIEVSRSSRQPVLDAAARHIVRLAAPFPPFPPDIRRDTDILSITRTWTFTSSDTLESE
uniref:TonB family protein n=1 Tax=Candidatus Nitrotoga fabula TaxID=2182327 RepID=A0A2X0SEL0_9PROT|nr:TonB family protein [Candidatus Nitrotoga fabula]